MSEPRRLLDEGGTPFERSLLSAVRSERPSAELQHRMRQGLVVAGVAATAKVAVAGWVKVVALGVVAAGVGAGIATWERQRGAPLPAAARAVAVATSSAWLEPAPAPMPAPVAAEPVALESARVRPAPAPSGDLREEIRLLDQARAAVRDGAHGQALKLLGRYERRFPRGQFRQEAQVLKVEALERTGNRKAALDLGKKFLAEHPESPHVERVESVTGSPR